MRKGQMETSFAVSGVVKPPSAGRAGDQTNPGVCAALNTPSTEGKIKTTWYMNPREMPSLAKEPMQAIDSSFRGQLDMTPGQKTGPDNSREYPYAPMQSSFEVVGGNPLGIKLNAGRSSGSAPSFSVPASNMNDGVGYGKNTSGGGSSDPFA